MDVERRAGDNQALPLVSISSRVSEIPAKQNSSEHGSSVPSVSADAAEVQSAVVQSSGNQPLTNGELDRSRTDAVTRASAAGDLGRGDASRSSNGASKHEMSAKRQSSDISAFGHSGRPTGSRNTDGTGSLQTRDTDAQMRSTANDSGNGGANTARRRSRIGHRRVDEAGTVTYKRTPTSQLMHAIQMGIRHSIVAVASKPERDILISDFRTLEFVEFPAHGSHITPPHDYNDFTFKTYAPFAFRFFRALFGIKSDQFINSLTSCALIELSNPGASGSIFYLSPDYEFIIKTVQKKEAHFLQKLLPGYYLNLNQNPRTLLPKFYGLYCYCSLGKKIRFVVMNNLLPTVVLHEKYDLKGSSFKREASDTERAKASPTLKDLDFRRIHPDGLEFDPDSYQALVKTLQRDCRVLESFRIMDYSLLLGIHNVDQAKLQASNDCNTNANNACAASSSHTSGVAHSAAHSEKETAGTSRCRGEIDSAHAASDSDDAHEQDTVDSLQIGLSRLGIPARNSKGEKLLVYAGIIDILQYYRLAKRLEHAWKSVVTDGDTVSVHHPSFYADRFLKFTIERAFKKGPPRKCSLTGSSETLELLATRSS